MYMCVGLFKILRIYFYVMYFHRCEETEQMCMWIYWRFLAVGILSEIRYFT